MVTSQRSELLLYWHMHQPSYVHPSTGRVVLPWVRLHACSGYLDMARALERHPSVRATVNFVPVLVDALEALGGSASESAPGAAFDELERLAAMPADSLDEAGRREVLARSFSVARRAIDARPRYLELERMRSRGEAFSSADLRDLECLFLLAWIGFAARADDPAIEALDAKGRRYCEDDKASLLAAVRRAAAAVLPAWRRGAGGVLVELTARPNHPPIAPPRADPRGARGARPDDDLPPRFAWPDDAREHIERALHAHRAAFGAAPRGMWPPELCLSPEAVRLYAAAGVGWLAGDEETLVRSTARTRRPRGRGPEVDEGAGPLHTRLWRFEGVDLVFRDRALSDRVGFEYPRLPADRAASDLVAAAKARAPNGGMVGVFLDGENCWEAFPRRGADFLEALYVRLEEESESGGLCTRTISEAVAARSPGAALAQLHSGSWIDAAFRIWIGDPVKNRAWKALGEARRALARAEAAAAGDGSGARTRDARAGEGAAEALRRAKERLLAAEGSDWFWWFGEPNSSLEDPIFDELFRAHLVEAWRALGEEPPPSVRRPFAEQVRAAAGRRRRGPG